MDLTVANAGGFTGTEEVTTATPRGFCDSVISFVLFLTATQ